jgi:hypothetical protein
MRPAAFEDQVISHPREAWPANFHPRMAVVVRPPRIKLISSEEFEQAVSTIAMIAHRLDADGRQMPDTENGGLTGASTQIDS